VSRPANVQLPAEALSRWRALERDSPAEPLGRVLVWIARLQARLASSGGRLARLMIATGLCEAEVIVECVHAQIDAGPPGHGALGYDVAADLFAVAESASLDSLERLSARLAGLDWSASLDGVEELHCDLAGRLFADRREREGEAVLARVGWHLPLIRLLERRGAQLSPGLRERLVERAAELVATSHLGVEYHVGLFVRLAVIAGDRRWLERARELLAELSPEQLETTPDYAHPVEDVAWGFAVFGEFEQAQAMLAALAPADRWWAELRLLPHAGEQRAAMIEALFDEVEPLDLAWAWLLESVPELAPRVLPRLSAIVDEVARFEELSAVARFLTGEPAETTCRWMLAHALALAPDSERWSSVWADTLDALHDCGLAAMLDDVTRRGLIDRLLAQPELDLWREAAPFVPDDRVVAVLEHAHAQLAVADHYLVRETWIELGLAVIDRAPSDSAERFRSLAAEALAFTSLDGTGLERLAGWTPEQRHTIVLARLRQHQCEFLPAQLIQPWLQWMARLLPAEGIAVAEDPIEQARCRAALDDILMAPGWPTHERVIWVFALLGRCAGEGAVRRALAALGDPEVDSRA
jgi:hypothetical protein